MSGNCFGSNASTPEVDNTPVGAVIKPCPTRNFVLVLGGPGKWNPKDKDHDAYWGNYFVASQYVLGAKGIKATTRLLSGECVHWLVYEQAYANRWETDYKSRIEHLEAQAKKYPHGYATFIKEYVTSVKQKYVAIDSYHDIWEAIHALPDESLTRLFYFGHGGPKAFFLRWARDDSRPASPGQVLGDPTEDEIVDYSKIDAYRSWLAKKAKSSDSQVSKLYACTTADWASKWHDATGLKAQGSINKITFKNIRTGGGLSGLESDGSPDWRSY